MVNKLLRKWVEFQSVNQLSLQVGHDYVNRHWYFTSMARVALQRYLLINLDLSNPIVSIYDFTRLCFEIYFKCKHVKLVLISTPKL